jgi:hypothetical protein
MAENGKLELEDLAGRRFSFYPAIVNIEHNEWELKRSAWSEILVANTATRQELWIPRRFIGEVSSVDDPVLIVGLRKELEYAAGAVWPRERRLLSMQRLGSKTTAGADEAHAGPAQGPVHGPAPGAEGKIGRLIGAAVVLAIAVIVVVVAVMQRPVSYSGVEQLALQLTAADDYSSIVRKLGPPTEDHWRSDAGGEIHYRALYYKNYSFTLILMGTDRDSARYIGAFDKTWKPVHSVRLAGGRDTLAMLRGLKKF